MVHSAMIPFTLHISLARLGSKYTKGLSRLDQPLHSTTGIDKFAPTFDGQAVTGLISVANP